MSKSNTKPAGSVLHGRDATAAELARDAAKKNAAAPAHMPADSGVPAPERTPAAPVHNPDTAAGMLAILSDGLERRAERAAKLKQADNMRAIMEELPLAVQFAGPDLAKLTEHLAVCRKYSEEHKLHISETDAAHIAQFAAAGNINTALFYKFKEARNAALGISTFNGALGVTLRYIFVSQDNEIIKGEYWAGNPLEMEGENITVQCSPKFAVKLALWARDNESAASTPISGVANMLAALKAQSKGKRGKAE